jgi:hypothetical protein
VSGNVLEQQHGRHLAVGAQIDLQIQIAAVVGLSLRHDTKGKR